MYLQPTQSIESKSHDKEVKFGRDGVISFREDILEEMKMLGVEVSSTLTVHQKFRNCRTSLNRGMEASIVTIVYKTFMLSVSKFLLCSYLRKRSSLFGIGTNSRIQII